MKSPSISRLCSATSSSLGMSTPREYCMKKKGLCVRVALWVCLFSEEEAYMVSRHCSSVFDKIIVAGYARPLEEFLSNGRVLRVCGDMCVSFLSTRRLEDSLYFHFVRPNKRFFLCAFCLAELKNLRPDKMSVCILFGCFFVTWWSLLQSYWCPLSAAVRINLRRNWRRKVLRRFLLVQ